LIPIYSTDDVEKYLDLAAEHFSMILLHEGQYTRGRIRVRADRLKEKRWWWLRTDQQRKLWREQGGIMRSTQACADPEDHDCAFLGECPISLAELDKVIIRTRYFAVIAKVRKWVCYERAIERMQGHSEYKLLAARLALERMQDYMGKLPILTPAELRRLSSSRLDLRPRPSFAPESPEGAEPLSDTSPEAP